MKALSNSHPEWKEKEPFASLLKGDLKAALAGGERAVLEIVMATHAGIDDRRIPPNGEGLDCDSQTPHDEEALYGKWSTSQCWSY